MTKPAIIFVFTGFLLLFLLSCQSTQFFFEQGLTKEEIIFSIPNNIEFMRFTDYQKIAGTSLEKYIVNRACKSLEEDFSDRKEFASSNIEYGALFVNNSKHEFLEVCNLKRIADDFRQYLSARSSKKEFNEHIIYEYNMYGLKVYFAIINRTVMYGTKNMFKTFYRIAIEKREEEKNKRFIKFLRTYYVSDTDFFLYNWDRSWSNTIEYKGSNPIFLATLFAEYEIDEMYIDSDFIIRNIYFMYPENKNIKKLFENVELLFNKYYDEEAEEVFFFAFAKYANIELYENIIKATFKIPKAIFNEWLNKNRK
jgi:hypothetical protein